MNLFQPEPAPIPRCWKSLGHVCVGLETMYAIDNIGCDMDIDSEAELRAAVVVIAQQIHAAGQGLDGLVMVKEARWPARRQTIQFAACDCHSKPSKRFACEWN